MATCINCAKLQVELNAMAARALKAEDELKEMNLRALKADEPSKKKKKRNRGRKNNVGSRERNWLKLQKLQAQSRPPPSPPVLQIKKENGI
uniref:Uncharacterized protein n=1 Tax=Meloidogyne floridensis TaxID=298350 RepID=A0A915NN94_9BILA